jgi:hypothetical protein
MATNKTQATAASVEAYFDERASEAQRPDCEALVAMLSRLTGELAVLWGPSIVGFGRYRYRYESGREGEMCLAGFAVRGKDLVVYVDVESEAQQARLALLGKHRIGTSCLYVKRLADVDGAVLEALVAASIAETRRRYG